MKSKRVLSYLLVGTMAFSAIPTIMPQIAIASEVGIQNVDEKELLEIPDEHFRKHIVEKILGADRDPIPADAEVPPPGYNDPLYGSDLVKIKAIEKIQVFENANSKEIKSLEGLEYFKGLKHFEIERMDGLEIDSTDFSKNTNLEWLEVYGIVKGVNVTGLTNLVRLSLTNYASDSIDLSTNKKLEQLIVYPVNGEEDKGLKSIDLSNNPELTRLFLNSNPLKEIDVSNNKKLEDVRFSDTDIQSIDLSNLTSLEVIYMQNTPVSKLNLKGSQNIEYISISGSKELKSLNLDNYKKLEVLYVSQSGLESLSVNGTEKLGVIHVDSNKLKTLDLKDAKIRRSEDAAVSVQRVNVSGKEVSGELQVDMADVVGAENIDKIKSFKHGTFDAATGIVTVALDSPSFEYVYHTATMKTYSDVEFDVDMEVIVNVLNADKIVSMELIEGPDKVDYKVGDKFNPAGMIISLEDDKGNKLEIGPDKFEEYGISYSDSKLKITDNSVEISREGLESISIPITVKSKDNGEPITEGKSYIDGYPDGTFKPDDSISRAESAKIISFALKGFDGKKSYDTTFSDVPEDSWYKNIVGYMQELKAVDGYDDGTFRPDNKITRAEFAAIVTRLNGYKETSLTSKFSDTDDHWAKTYIEFAESKGWVEGYGDGTFKPEQEITRAEAVTIINRIMGLAIDETEIDNNIDNYKKFTDLTKEHWAFYQIMKATNY